MPYIRKDNNTVTNKLVYVSGPPGSKGDPGPQGPQGSGGSGSDFNSANITVSTDGTLGVGALDNPNLLKACVVTLTSSAVRTIHGMLSDTTIGNMNPIKEIRNGNAPGGSDFILIHNSGSATSAKDRFNITEGSSYTIRPGESVQFGGYDYLAEIWLKTADSALVDGELASILATRVGKKNGEVRQCFGNSSSGFGDGTFKWVAGDSTTADGAMVLGAITGGRWHRIWSREINPCWFGADSTGIIDSTSAINKAVAYAATFSEAAVLQGGEPGVTVRMPPGVFLVSTEGQNRPYKLLMKSNVSFVGSGRGVTIVRSALNQPENARTVADDLVTVLENLTIAHFTIDGRETEQPPTLNYQRAGIFFARCKYVTITDMEILNTGDCIRINSDFADHCNISFNYCHSCPTDIGREVIQVNGCRDTFIGYNKIVDCPWAGAIKMEACLGWNNLFVGNQARNVGTGFAIRTTGTEFDFDQTASQIKLMHNTLVDVHVDVGIVCFGRNVLIHGNTVEGSQVAGIAVLGEAEGVIVSNNHIRHVHGDGDAPMGILVEARDSQYYPRNVTIQANHIEVDRTEDPNTIGIRVNQCRGFVSVLDNKIHEGGNMLDDLEIPGGVQTGIYITASGIDCHGIIVRGNTITVASSGYGIWLSGTSMSATLTDVLVDGNYVTPESGATSTRGLEVFSDVDYLTLVNNNFRRCATPTAGVLAVTNRQVANNFGTIA